MDKLAAYLKELYRPFHPSQVEWKPGKVTNSGDKAQAQAYADLRAYQNRLDEVCGADWAVSYTPWGDRLICNLTICGVTRSSTGEPSSDSERWEIAGTASEAQAFKRACAMFGLGRYLYNLPDVWAEFDPQRKRFTEQGAAKLNAILMAHYKRSFDETPKNAPASVSTSQQTAPAPQSAQTPDISPQRADSDAPSDEEVEIINRWQSPPAAQAWMVAQRHIADAESARRLWLETVRSCGGWSPSKAAKVYLAYLRAGRSQAVAA